MSDGMIDCNVGWISMNVAGCTWTVMSDGTKDCVVRMYMDCDVGWYDGLQRRWLDAHGLRCWMV